MTQLHNHMLHEVGCVGYIPILVHAFSLTSPTIMTIVTESWLYGSAFLKRHNPSVIERKFCFNATIPTSSKAFTLNCIFISIYCFNRTQNVTKNGKLLQLNYAQR